MAISRWQRHPKGTTTFPVTIGVLEILVAGVTASIWFGMLVASLAGWRGPPEWLANGSTSLLAYATLAYGLGVIVDGAADSLFTLMMKRAWPEQHVKEPSRIARSAVAILSPRKDGKVKPPLPLQRFRRLREAALLRDDGLAKFMEYQRSRQRIARALTLNLLLLLPVGVWFLTRTARVDSGFVVSFAVAVLVGIVVSGRTSERLRDRYEEHLDHAPYTEPRSAATSPYAGIRAAAVCAHLLPDDLTGFLLVRTKETTSSVERWTFPKGHVEAGESLLDAAVRELLEEAGVKGLVDPDPLPPYRFPGGSSGWVVVIPYLVQTREQQEPTEPGRAMRWCSADEAKALLRVNREPPFATEHDRVIDEATERLRRH
jgi:8-oxo-dGTP pyrophosphatase MutT (NUDIX family)